MMRGDEELSSEPPLSGGDPGAWVLLAIGVAILAAFIGVAALLPR